MRAMPLSASLVTIFAATATAQPPAQKANLTVKLVGPDGKTPLGGATVVLVPPEVDPTANSPQRKVKRVWSEAMARFKDVPQGPYRVYVYFGGTWGQPPESGQRAAMTKNIDVTQKEKECTLVAIGVPCLTGRLTEADGKTPVVGKEIRLNTVRPDPREGFGGGAEFRIGKTDQQGRFALPVPPAELCELEVTLATSNREGFARNSWWTYGLGRVTPKAESNTEVDYKLPAFPGVTGRVFGPDGKPLADTEVGFLFQAREDRYIKTMPAFVTTSGEGTYRVDRIPLGVSGSFAWVSGKGYALGGSLATREGEVASGNDYRLKPFATVTLTMREHDGDPVVGQRISPSRRYGNGPQMGVSLPSAKTDDEGVCTFEEVPEGEYSISWPHKYSRPTPGGFSVKPGQKVAVTITYGPSNEERGIELTVRLTDAQGRTVAGAQAYLDPKVKGLGYRHRPQGPVDSAADGSFAFKGVVDGQHTVLVYRAGRPVGWQYFEVAEGGPRSVTVAVPGVSGRIVGQITDRTTGGPVAGVSVMAILPVLQSHVYDMTATPPNRALKWFDDPFPHTKTANDGSYSFDGLPPAEYTVIAAEVEFPTAVRHVVLPYQQGAVARADFAKEPEGSQRLVLRLVTPDGQPLANTPVRMSARSVWSLTTDRNGRIEKDLGSPGRHNVTLYIEGHERVNVGPIVVGPNIEPGEIEVRVKPIRRRDVTVRVEWGDTGTPAASASVRAMRATDLTASPLQRAEEPSALTDATGEVAMTDVPTDQLILLASPTQPAPDGKTYAAGKAGPLKLDDSEAPATITVKLPLAASVSGTVTHADGDPVEGARVIASSSEYRSGFDRGPQATTTAAGTFTVTGLSPGRWRLYLRLPGSSSFSSAGEVAVEAGREVKDVQLGTAPRSSRLVTVSGRVFLLDGRTPAVGALVRCPEMGTVDGQRMSDPVQATTDATGAFTLRGRTEGPVLIEAWVPGVGFVETKEPARENGQIYTQLTVTRGADLSGQLLSPNGAPVAYANIVAMRPPSPGPPTRRRSFATERQETWTDDNGKFRFAAMATGKWLVSGFLHNLRRTRATPVTLKGGGTSETLELHDEPLVPEVRGRVVGPDGTTPVRGARLLLATDSDLASRSMIDTYTGDDGTFRVRWLSPGDYRVAIYPTEPELALTHCQGVALMAGVDAEFRVPRAATITGRVVSADPRKPVTSGRVRTYSPKTTDLAVALSAATATVDQEGAYRLERLAPGEYTVYYFEKDDLDTPKAEVKVTVREGEEVEAPDMGVTRARLD